MSQLSRRSVLWGGLGLAVSSRVFADDALGVPEAEKRQRAIEQPAELIQDARVETLDLEVEGKVWRLLIGTPAVKAPPEGYSVIYALDGNACFPELWHARERLAPNAPVIIVGVGYPITQRFDVERRFWDLTPPTAQEYLRDPTQKRATGGRDAFLGFLAGAARQAIAQRFAIDAQQQTLYGHSLGGLFALYALFQRPSLFQAYVTADPAIWWNNTSILQEEAAFRTGVVAAGGQLVAPKRVLIEKSGKVHGGHSAEQLWKDREAAYSLGTRLSALGGLNVYYRDFSEHSHPSLIAPSLEDALRFHLGTLDAVEQLRPERALA